MGIIVLIAILISNWALMKQFDVVWNSTMSKNSKVYCIFCMAILLILCNGVLVYAIWRLFH